MKVPVRISARDATLLSALQSGLSDEELAAKLGVSVRSLHAELASLAHTLQRLEHAVD